MLKEFEGTIGLAGLYEFGEKTLDRIAAGPQIRFRAVLDSAIAESIVFAITFGERRHALRLLLDSCVSFERQAWSLEPLKATLPVKMRSVPTLRLIKS